MCWFFFPFSKLQYHTPEASSCIQSPADRRKFTFSLTPSSGSTYLPRDREVPVGASRTLFRIAGALNANKAWKRSPTIFDKFSNCFLAVYKSIVYKNQSTQTNSWSELSSRRRLLISTAERSSWVSHSREYVILNICRLDGPTLYMCIFLNMELISWRPDWHPGLCICHHGLFQSLLVLKVFFFSIINTTSLETSKHVNTNNPYPNLCLSLDYFPRINF